MSKIDFIIGPRAHEIIRAKVATILADELYEQAAMTYDDDFLLPLFVHRFKPPGPDELPLAILTVNTGKFDNRTAVKSDGEFSVFIDVYQKSFATEANRGDTLSSFGAHKIAGVIMGILDNPVYYALDFTPGFIIRSNVDSFEGGEMERSDAHNITVVRVVLIVKAVQKEQLQEAIPIAGNDTHVTLNESDEGFYYTFNAESE